MVERVMTDPQRCLRPREVAARLGIGVSTLWRWQREGRFPKPVRLSARCSIWRLADIEVFLAGRAGQEARHA